MKVIEESSIDDEFITTIGIGYKRHPLFCDSLLHLGEKTIDRLKRQKDLIQTFYTAVAQIGKLALHDQIDNSIKEILFSEKINGIGIEYHIKLRDFGWKTPLLYRTDQSINGKIFEIQPPGSGWGDIPLILRILYKKTANKNMEKYRQEYLEKYVKAIRNITNKEIPRVGHFLDASSNPASMKYLLAATSDLIKYWGMDEETRMDDIDCVITHSAISVLSLNFYETYEKKANDNELVFVMPPNLLFDQKIIYALPFLKSTRTFFSDEVRDLFPYTSYIHNDGFQLEDGSFITIDEFIKLPKSHRHYYLKYAGPSTNYNWGSRAVYRLDKKDSLQMLENACELSHKGQVWIIQSDVTVKSDICSENYSTDINNIMQQNNHIKLSAFYTPYDYLGCKVMYRNHYKVHGTNDTYVGVGVSNE